MGAGFGGRTRFNQEAGMAFSNRQEFWQFSKHFKDLLIKEVKSELCLQKH